MTPPSPPVDPEGGDPTGGGPGGGNGDFADDYGADGGIDDGPVVAPETIICVDCGGRCHLLSYAERDELGNELPFRTGDVVAYRCEDCLDRWDIVLE